MRKKVLLIAYYYPPYNVIAALRASKFAKYLPEYGWEPVVLTRDWSEKKGGLERPPGTAVVTTNYRDRLRFIRSADSKWKSRFTKNSAFKNMEKRITLRRLASFLKREFLEYPDDVIGWKNIAIRAGKEIIEKENIQLIFSTSSPVTSHLIASEIKRKTGIPWVADFRDLWTQNHYSHHSHFRRLIEVKLEIKTMEGADMMITVSEPWGIKLGQLHRKTVDIITNGYDDEDYSIQPPSLTSFFSLTYTGQLYAEKRDPTLLFSAVKHLLNSGTINHTHFKIRYYGPDGHHFIKLADRSGVSEVVTNGGVISYKEAIRRQRESVALLLLNWKSQREKGVYTGKVFEYLGARRPIIAIPRNNGVVEQLLGETGAGVILDNEKEIISKLDEWYKDFLVYGDIPIKYSEKTIRYYTRREQAKKLAKLFDKIMETSRTRA